MPLLSRVGADRADTLRTDIDAAVAGWADALLLRVDPRNQVLIADGRVVLGKAAGLGDKPPEHAVFLGRLEDGRHVWAIRGALEAPEDPTRETEVLDLRRAGHDLRRRQRAAGGHRDRAAELARQRPVQRHRRGADQADQGAAGRGSTRSPATRSSRASTRR